MPRSSKNAGRRKDADYLEQLTRKVFISGFAWPPLKKRWPHFRKVFYAFDPETVAEIPAELIEHLCEDPGLIRNRVKIRATVANAAQIVRLVREHGSFHEYLRSLDGMSYNDRARELSKRFKCAGPNTVYYFLMDVGEPVPETKPEGVG